MYGCVHLYERERLPPSLLCIFIITFLVRSFGYVQPMTRKNPDVCAAQPSVKNCGSWVITKVINTFIEYCSYNNLLRQCLLISLMPKLSTCHIIRCYLQSKKGIRYVEIMPFLLSVHLHGRGREQSFGSG